MTEEYALTKALIEQQKAEIAAQKAEIVRLNAVINDLNEAWHADRLTRIDGDSAIYMLHEEDKTRS